MVGPASITKQVAILVVTHDFLRGGNVERAGFFQAQIFSIHACSSSLGGDAGGLPDGSGAVVGLNLPGPGTIGSFCQGRWGVDDHFGVRVQSRLFLSQVANVG